MLGSDRCRLDSADDPATQQHGAAPRRSMGAVRWRIRSTSSSTPQIPNARTQERPARRTFSNNKRAVVVVAAASSPHLLGPAAVSPIPPHRPTDEERARMPVLDAQWIERKLGVARTTKQQVRAMRVATTGPAGFFWIAAPLNHAHAHTTFIHAPARMAIRSGWRTGSFCAASRCTWGATSSCAGGRTACSPSSAWWGPIGPACSSPTRSSRCPPSSSLSSCACARPPSDGHPSVRPSGQPNRSTTPS